MRIGQLESLTDMELSLLLYVFNVLEPIRPPIKMTPRLLLSLRHDMLLWTLSQIEPKLNAEGKKVFTTLMVKLNRTWMDEVKEYANSPKPIFSQPEFQF